MMGKFTQQSASDYDSRIVRLVPGYGLLHELSACMLAAELAPHEEACILIAGLGTGRELQDLAQRGPAWRFTAVDPSQAMLDAARARAAADGYADRLSVHVTPMQAFDGKSTHAAALALLVAHFVADDGGRAAFLKAIGRSLNPGAPLLLVDLADPDGAFREAYRSWALGQGMNGEAADAMFARFATNFHPIGETRLRALLSEAGFGVPTMFFQALGYRGYLAHRN